MECPICYDSVADAVSLYWHVRASHSQYRLTVIQGKTDKELLRTGWTGFLTCPLCRQSVLVKEFDKHLGCDASVEEHVFRMELER